MNVDTPIQTPLTPSQTGSDRSKYKCDVCAATFARREHLNRHSRSHTKEKPFRCPICKKNFTRSDILQRHQNAHAAVEEKAVRTRPFRACIACAAARVRCSGGSPCSGCEKKGASCNYASRKKSRSAPIQTEHDIDADNLSPAMDGRRETEALPMVGSSHEGVQHLGSQPVTNLDANNDAQHQAQTPNTQAVNQWNSGWMDHPDQLQYDQFANNGQIAGFGFGIEQGTGYQAFNSINWASPSSELCKDWDFQFTSLMDNAIPASAQIPFMVIPNGYSNIPDGQQSNTWNQTLGSQLGYTATPVDTSCSPMQPSTSSSTALTASVVESVSSHTPTSVSYIDNVGARGTMQRPLKKRRYSSVRENDSAGLHGHDTISSGYDTVPSIVTGNASSNKVRWVTADIYEALLENIELDHRDNGETFDPATIPGINLLNHFCNLYFEHFHPVFPFLRKIPIQRDYDAWMIALAVAATGARYWVSNSTPDFRDILCQYLRTAVDNKARRAKKDRDQVYATMPFVAERSELRLPVIQARILNVLLMAHSGISGLMDSALSQFPALVATSRQMKLLLPMGREWPADTFNNPILKKDWLDIQLRSRSGYMIWILDFMFIVEFNQQPQLELADAQAPLPCSEDIWDNTLSNNISVPSTSHTLSTALETLYTEKRLIPHTSEFSRILLILGISRQTLEIHRSHRNRMASWTPTSKTPLPSSPPLSFTSAELWPPSSPTLSAWRNSACDCLDILHWSANSTIAQSAGHEHPTVLHLHLARVIILSPLGPIRDVVEILCAGGTFDPQAGNSTNGNNPAFRVLQWAIRDQYKARLSLVHAAATFWYMRRYSCDSFIESWAVYISTLVLWAFTFATGFAKRQEVQREQRSGEGREEEEELEIAFINLDRPVDDESVQTFVRLGQRIAVHMVRVGDIRGEQAPGRILREGIRLLGGGEGGEARGGEDENANGMSSESESPWGITRAYIQSLQRLEAVMKREEK